MEEKLKKVYDIIVDFIFSVNKKFDKVNQKIFEQTNVKVNLGAIVMIAIAVIFIAIVVKSVLGWLWSML